MRTAAMAATLSFTERFEGSVPYMYLDVGGQAANFTPAVSVGYGFLVDPLSSALAHPWLHKTDSTPATPQEVAAEWHTVKARVEFAKLGGGAPQWSHLTTLYLSQATMLDMFNAGVRVVEYDFRKFFAGWDAFPANAQLGIFSMSWACGGYFEREFPHFTASANAGDWAACAGPPGDAGADLSKRGLAWMRDGTPGGLKANENPGLRNRNLANKLLFQAAADGGDPEALISLPPRCY